MLLREQQRAYNTSNLEKQRNYIYLLIFILLVLLGLSVIVLKKNKVIRQKNVEIKKKKENIERLLKEVHHRVKNNLQMIVGLLDLHQSSVKNEMVSLVLNDAGSRVKSVALVHQNLYSGDTDMVTIGFQKYIEELVENLLYSYKMLDKIDTTLNIDELKIPFDKAVIFGLLITELVTNVLKHAFPNNEKGKLTISVSHQIAQKNIVLVVKDNGCGLPEKFDVNQDSFGLDLIRSMVNDLEGDIQFITNNGTSAEVNLKQFI